MIDRFNVHLTPVSMVGGFSPFVYSASFDCSKAGTDVEHLICDNEVLSLLDEQLSDRYKQALEDESFKVIKSTANFLIFKGFFMNKLFVLSLYIFIFLLPSSSFSEVFRDESNPNLQLCKEFKAYIERHADEPLHCGLIPDEKFAGFRLPNWEPAPDGLGLRIDIQAKTVQIKSSRIKYPYTISDYRKIVDQAEIESQRSIRYRVSQFDLNHDGEVERIIMRDRPSRCAEKRTSYHRMRVYGENLNLDSSFIGLSGYAKQGGQAFFYKGRIYSVSGSDNIFEIHEPTGHGGDKLISTRPICTFIRKANS